MDVKEARDARARRKAALDTPTNLTANATRDLSGALTILLADMFALYVKTKNFHWHVSGPHFRTTRTTYRRKTCWPSFAATIWSSRSACVRCMTFATSTATWQVPVCSKTG